MRVNVEKWAFALPVPELTDDIVQFFGEKLDTPISDAVVEWLTNTGDMIRGSPEAFANPATRDAELGPHGKYAYFLPTSWAAVEAAGFDLSKTAIGHRLDAPGFNEVAPHVVDAVVRSMTSDEPATIVIARVRYEVTVWADGQITVGSLVEFGVAGDEEEIARTGHWLRNAVADRLPMLATKAATI